ncbi:MAG: DNA/RNA non-specific endonuclease [Prevotella sp.]
MRKKKQQALLAAVVFTILLCTRFVPGISSRHPDTSQQQELQDAPHPPQEAKELAMTVEGAQLLHRTGYVCCYNADTRLPHWVAWVLTAAHTTGPYKRNGIKFQEDTDVEAPRATHEDYMRSGYDRGHLCPSGDNKWSEQAQRESFLMTNICPQTHNLNGGDWNEMEQQCRKWAEEYGTLYIVSGPILYRQKHKTIGKNKVVVPEAFFKVVLRLQPEPQAIGFIYKNADGNRPKGDYVNTVNEVERITGFDFFPFLNDSIEEQVEDNSDLLQWGL